MCVPVSLLHSLLDKVLEILTASWNPIVNPSQRMSKDGRPILLSLDGGGAKGWSQLTFLHSIICLIKKKTLKNDDTAELLFENIYPCEYFVSLSHPL